MEWGFITGNDRRQTDAALVRRFRQAVAKRDRAALFDAVVREHRDAVLARCTGQLWPDADAALAAARDLFITAYLAMGDPAKLARPELLREWLLGLADHGELAPGPDQPDVRGSAARQASLRYWLEQIVATLPQPRQQMYDLFVRRALNSRNAAMELGTDVAEARRLRRENREAIQRAFEVTALAAAETALQAGGDSRSGQTAGCGQLQQTLADARRDGGERVRRDSVVLPADLRLMVTRHVSHCDACRDQRAAGMAQWAQDLLPMLAGAELNEQVIEDLRTIPESARSRGGAPVHGRHRGDGGGQRGAAPVAAGKAFLARRAAVAGAGLLAVLLLLGFVEPGFLLNTAASIPRSSSASPSSDPGVGSPSSSGNPPVTGTSAEATGRPVEGTAKGSPGSLPPIPGVTSPATTSPYATPTQPSQDVLQPSPSPTSASSQPTTASPASSSTASATASATQPSSVPSTTPPTTSAPTTPAPTSTSPTPTPTPTVTTTPTPTPTPTPSTSTTAASLRHGALVTACAPPQRERRERAGYQKTQADGAGGHRSGGQRAGGLDRVVHRVDVAEDA